MAIKFLHDLDVAGNLDLNLSEIQNFKVQILASDPSPAKGLLYYNSGSDVLRYCSGTSASDWTDLSSATGDITSVIGGNNIDVSGGATGDATVNLDASTISAIDANTAKTGITSAQGTKVDHLTVTASTDLDTMRSNVSANNAKNTNVTTNLSVTANGSGLTVNSSDGNNASLPAADTDNWGVMTDEMFDQMAANTAKTGITSAESTKLGHISVSQGVDLDTMESNISTNNAKNSYPSADSTKVGHISVSQAVDLDTIESNVTTNNAKTGITATQADAITANTAKTGITESQASAISANTAKVTYPGSADATELNILDGATITTAQLNRCDATSSIQTQIDTKAPTASPTFTGTPAAPTADAGTNSTQVATTAFVTGAVSDLVGGAPGALDTLNELAEAIGDDASYASTITTALAAKAPLASPTFTGTVSGITASMVGLSNVANIAVSGSNTGDEVDGNTTTKGIVEIATVTEARAGDLGSVVVTPAGLAARTYTAAIGDGEATSIAVTHGLGTRNVIVQMYDSSSYEDVYAQVVRNSTSQVTVDFNSAPASGDVTIMVTKVGSDS